MRYLTNRIAKRIFAGRPAANVENLCLAGGRDGSARFDTGWGEALLASQSDEIARMYVDYLGSFRK
jgi:hypothetical protein